VLESKEHRAIVETYGENARASWVGLVRGCCDVSGGFDAAALRPYCVRSFLSRKGLIVACFGIGLWLRSSRLSWMSGAVLSLGVVAALGVIPTKTSAEPKGETPAKDSALTKPAPEACPENNLIIEAKAVGLASLEVTVSASDIPAPLKFVLEAKEGLVSSAIRVPPGSERLVSVVLRDAKGKPRGQGAGLVSLRADAFTTEAIPIVGAGRGSSAEVMVTNVRVMIEPIDTKPAKNGSIRYRARLSDATGRDLPLLRGRLTWQLANPGQGRLSYNPARPSIVTAYPFPPVPPNPGPPDPLPIPIPLPTKPFPWPRETIPKPCLCIPGGKCRCLSLPTTPTPMTYKAVTAGDNHSCVLDANGVAYCWGDNFAGQLGTTTATLCTMFFSSQSCSETPVSVSGQHQFTSISAGGAHTCAIDSDGHAWCWGSNQFGQLGLGGTTASAAGGATPQLVSPTLTFTSIGAGTYHTCALGTDKLVRCWGKSDCGQAGSVPPLGQVGTLAPTTISSTVQFKALSVGAQHNCAINANNEVMCWGRGDGGQIGFNGSISPPTCGNSSAVPGLATFIPVVSGVPVSTGSAGGYTSCAGWAGAYSPTLGSITCWGYGSPITNGSQHFIAYTGQLTVGGTIKTSDAVCARNTAGAAFCWGDNTRGRLGVAGTSATQANPAGVSVPPNAFAEIDVGALHTCGIDDTKQQVFCWGYNILGQVGDGSVADRSVPTKVLLP
jgi:hypothetical protein